MNSVQRVALCALAIARRCSGFYLLRAQVHAAVCIGCTLRSMGEDKLAGLSAAHAHVSVAEPTPLNQRPARQLSVVAGFTQYAADGMQRLTPVSASRDEMTMSKVGLSHFHPRLAPVHLPVSSSLVWKHGRVQCPMNPWHGPLRKSHAASCTVMLLHLLCPTWPNLS